MTSRFWFFDKTFFDLSAITSVLWMDDDDGQQVAIVYFAGHDNPDILDEELGDALICALRRYHRSPE